MHCFPILSQGGWCPDLRELSVFPSFIFSPVEPLTYLSCTFASLTPLTSALYQTPATLLGRNGRISVRISWGSVISDWIQIQLFSYCSFSTMPKRKWNSDLWLFCNIKTADNIKTNIFLHTCGRHLLKSKESFPLFESLVCQSNWTFQNSLQVSSTSQLKCVHPFHEVACTVLVTNQVSLATQIQKAP